MSLLTIIQDATDRLLNIPRPSAVANNRDDTVRQMFALLNEEGRNLSESHHWQVLTRSVKRNAANNDGSVFTDQGEISDLCPGLLYIVDDTVWLSEQPLHLVDMNQQWRASMEAAGIPVTLDGYFIENNHLYTTMPTKDTQKLVIRYQSGLFVKHGDEYSDRFISDGDTSLLDERVLTLGLVWRWLERQGLPYQQEFANYTNTLSKLMARDGAHGRINAASGIAHRPYSVFRVHQ